MGVLNGVQIEIKGIVQGVGFRPFVYSLASRLDLKGWVRNTSAGVDIQVDGSPHSIQAFVQALRTETPPLARIDTFRVLSLNPQGFTGFEIVHSQSIAEAFQPISPDVSICADCLRELTDPHDRRYLYPFINCTNCGPRFTIIQDIPYDRPNTTMSGFSICQDCSSEYQDPLNRRFHAQPVACPVCGPHIWLELTGQEQDSLKEFSPKNARSDLFETQRLLQAGKIVAIKGLGGFHLACDALNTRAVAELRRRKLRVDKPFAVMMPDLHTVQEHCLVSDDECVLLESRQRPIVILDRRSSSPITDLVAPGQKTMGVMLPYTPLHYLLFTEHIVENSSFPSVLVMTSGNLSEEPIATDNTAARQRLGALADAFLMHNRPIQTRCDDSVVRVYRSLHPKKKSDNLVHKFISYTPIRRSRGYAPDPVKLPWEIPEILATGAELKNTFCLTRQDYAFISHHIGDLENYETLCAFEDGISHFERLFRIQPSAIAFDLHPDYLSTRYALQRAQTDSLPAIGVQHHHAHIAACMAENRLPQDQAVMGVSFDGTGYGEDGCIWGGEFLVCDYDSYTRPIHLAYAPLPGGEKAIQEPWRMALSWLMKANLPWTEELPPVRFAFETSVKPEQQLEILKHQIQTGLNAPQTSSIGRLFDAVAALIGLRAMVNYEAQAAIELEAIAADNDTGAYQFLIRDQDSLLTRERSFPQVFDPSPLFAAILEDQKKGLSVAVISARFHNGLANLVLEVCNRIRSSRDIADVVLSGGVWQNMTLLNRTYRLLEGAGFRTWIHHQIPTNDGGLALGQAVVAASRLTNKLLKSSIDSLQAS